jgi:hypothetical protein
MPSPAAPEHRRSGITGQAQQLDERGRLTASEAGSWRPITVNLRPHEVEQVAAAAEAAGMSRSGWIRELLLRTLAQGA